MATTGLDGYRKFFKTAPPAAQLGPLSKLPGVWRSTGTGWNMIALPSVSIAGSPPYRLLVNQFDEVLEFTLVDNNVPNRGLDFLPGLSPTEKDQFLVTLDYQQKIRQSSAADFPVSGKAGASGIAIHHEPGLWLHMKNQATPGQNIARLATIPHGDAVLAIGSAQDVVGMPIIPPENALPIGLADSALTNRYLAPYAHFHNTPFRGNVPDSFTSFPGFDPTNPQELLNLINRTLAVGAITKTTTLTVDTEIAEGGISNIPFIVKQANATAMKSTFWIQELRDLDVTGQPKLRMQYLQTVMLDFFDRNDGTPGLIRWPHISINTLEKDVTAPPNIYRNF